MISYFILAVLTTVYFIVLLPSSVTSPRSEEVERGTRNYISLFVSGLRKSLNTFQEYVPGQFYMP